MEEFFGETGDLLRNNWQAVERVAGVLLKFGEVSGEDIRRILNGSA